MNCLDTTKIHNDWIKLIDKIPKEIRKNVDEQIEISTKMYAPDLKILPLKEMRLASMLYFKPCDTRVVIIGQDPYISPNQPMGLSFSVPRGIPIPPSLKNIYKELETDIIGFKNPLHGDLTEWTKQGVLLLNASLTVVECISNSHQRIWSKFMNKFIEIFSDNNTSVVYLLMGNESQKLKAYIKTGIVIETPHPSPLARGAFFGTKPFSRCNEQLKKMGKLPVDWSNL
jgi:uracil-DNA glycosylase